MNKMKTNERNKELKAMMNEGLKKNSYEVKFIINCKSWSYDKPYEECTLLAGIAMRNMLSKIQTELDDCFNLIELKSQWMTQYNIGFDDSFIITFEIIGNEFNYYTDLRITYWAGFEEDRYNLDEIVKYETDTIAKIVNEEFEGTKGE